MEFLDSVHLPTSTVSRTKRRSCVPRSQSCSGWPWVRVRTTTGRGSSNSNEPVAAFRAGTGRRSRLRVYGRSTAAFGGPALAFSRGRSSPWPRSLPRCPISAYPTALRSPWPRCSSGWCRASSLHSSPTPSSTEGPGTSSEYARIANDQDRPGGAMALALHRDRADARGGARPRWCSSRPARRYRARLGLFRSARSIAHRREPRRDSTAAAATRRVVHFPLAVRCATPCHLDASPESEIRRRT